MESKFRCVIVDDEINSVELLASYVTDLYNNIEIVGKYYSWKDALSGIRSQSPDLLLLDVSMPGKSGIEMLKLLSDIDFEVIFVTAHTEYALAAFNFFATGYLLKPVDEMELASVMDKAIQRVISKKNNKSHNNPGPVNSPFKFGIPNNKGIDYVDIIDIIYFESTNKYTKIVTTDTVFLSSYNIGSFKKLITSELFFQVHKSFIINMMRVARYDSGGYVVMSDKKEIPVARSLKKDFLTHFITATNLK